MSTRDKSYMSASMVRTCLAAMGVMVAVSVASASPVHVRGSDRSSSVSSCDTSGQSNLASQSSDRKQHHKHNKKHKPRRGK
jgi:hypothetical protein